MYHHLLNPKKDIHLYFYKDHHQFDSIINILFMQKWLQCVPDDFYNNSSIVQERTRHVAHVCSPVFYLQYEKLHISSECNGFAGGKFIETVKYPVMWQSWQHWANPWVFNTDTHILDRCMWVRSTAELISHIPLSNIGLWVIATKEK